MIKIFLTFSLNMQHIVVDSHNVCTHGAKYFQDVGTPLPWDGGAADPQKQVTHARVIAPNLVALC